MLKRLITGIVILAIFVPLLVVKDLYPLFQILMMGLSGFASYEMIKMFEHSHKMPMLVKVVIIISTLLLYWQFVSQYNSETISNDFITRLNINIGFIPTLLIIITIFLGLMVAYDDFNGAAIGKALITILYTSVGFGSLTLLRATGLEYILFLFIITMLTDTFAYVFGRLFGKHKMSPKISPKKTWEGAIGGTITACACAVLFAFLYNKCLSNPDYSNNFCIFNNNITYMKFFSKFNHVQAICFVIIITILGSIMGQIGDLVASKFKRTYEIKDFSDIFPGHGGVLDRFDSAIYCGMFLWGLFLIFNNLVSLLA